jgi:gluconolactonase
MKLGTALIASALFAALIGTPCMRAQDVPHTPLPEWRELEMPAAPTDNKYPLTEDSKPHPGVPKGVVFSFPMNQSTIFPGSTRTISVYVPAEYTGDKPACVWVGLDSIGYNAPIVFDNLIAQHAMPVTIAIGVSSGTVPSADGDNNPRYDRSFEFDDRSDRLATFLLDEVFPAVEKHGAPGGRAIHLSTNPDDRGISGGSTGGIGSFTAAWRRPDAFHRVFMSIGTFVGMRGGDQFYVEVRKTDPKPIRIFMQDGINDEWGGGPEVGDWWMSNLTMQRALNYAGYDVRHVWGYGDHNGNQATALFPEAMRWLWRDYPKPIEARPSANLQLQRILAPGQAWAPLLTGCSAPVNLTVDHSGAVYFADAASGKLTPVTKDVPCPSAATAASVVFGSDGRAYQAAQKGGSVLAIASSGAKASIVDRLNVRYLTFRPNGDLYASVQTPGSQGEIWLIHPGGQHVKVAADLKGAAGLAVTPDGLWLYAAQRDSHFAKSYRIDADGTLSDGIDFFYLTVPPDGDDSGASALTTDREGRGYIATSLGIQVTDHNGRMVAILPLPNNQPATSLCFGGPDFSTLYAVAGGTVYARTMKIGGVAPGSAPIKVPNWGGG